MFFCWFFIPYIFLSGIINSFTFLLSVKNTNHVTNNMFNLALTKYPVICPHIHESPMHDTNNVGNNLQSSIFKVNIMYALV